MEKSEQELYDEKIHVLQELENDLIELTGDYFNALPYLEKIYHVVNIQKQIDKQKDVEVL